MVLIHPSSVLEHRPEWVLYHEFVLTSKNYIRTVLDVKADWFFDIDTEYFNLTELPECDAKRTLLRIRKRKSGKPSAAPANVPAEDSEDEPKDGED